MNDWVTKVLLGVFCLVLGIIGFIYIQNDTKKRGHINIYSFNFYVFSVVTIIAGLFMIYKRIFNKGILNKNCHSERSEESIR